MVPIKKILSILLCVVALGNLCSCAWGGKALTVLTREEKPLATVASDRAVAKQADAAYLQLVVEEAAKIIADQKQLSEAQAKKELYRGGYIVSTAFDAAVSERLAAACSEAAAAMDTAAVIADNQGHVCAVFSGGSDQDINYVTAKSPPCSAIKPLSVYAPALDNGTITWFTRYEDAPYTYLTNLEGAQQPWPSNANGIYSGRYAYIHQAIMDSTNTVAVKCLADYGVKKSIAFLEDNFGIVLDKEKDLAEANGPDEVIGNLALGALIDGVSPLDMAGYYQIFANGGTYQAPQTVTKISDSEGKVVYTAAYKPKQVIKYTTSAMMNRMLQEVVSPTGTGKNAACRGVEVAGKTGTDDDYMNNWFVGVTPDYSCAFWHGRYAKNVAAQIFSAAMTSIYEDKADRAETFPHLKSIRSVAYCTESGGRFTAGCSLVDTGYYFPEQVLSRCEMH